MPFRKRNGEPDRSPTAYAAGAPLSAAYSRHFPRPTGEFTLMVHQKITDSRTLSVVFFALKRDSNAPLKKRYGAPFLGAGVIGSANEKFRQVSLRRARNEPIRLK